MQVQTANGRITAVLGPTNTGKTYLAVERMLGHASGMIGCPLRLLAREIYDRVCAIRGTGQTALITGEERIIPARPRYFICTVESMPIDRQVEFVAIDEIQLAADPDRGHVFTDRLLHARGLSETMFLGAETMAPIIRQLVPKAQFVSRPRFSTLRYTGERKLTRLPPRSAVVAFSAAEVYALAEVIRRVRGGTAVVLGALSPRTRNAQVELYQSGEVDYLVATDAVGMGLNMNVDHVALAATRKFDGRMLRSLHAAEIAQIAGRAGRHMRDGTFGTTANIGALDGADVLAVESHTFPASASVFWRNTDLDLSSVAGLLADLERKPRADCLRRAPEGEDLISLRALAAMPAVAARATDYDRVSLLWDVCRIPDFRKVMVDAHFRLLAQIYGHLTGPSEQLPDAWVARLVNHLDRTEGDIDTLAQRIAHIRTWNYVAHRPGWVVDAAGLQDRARAIEDRLSDALHRALTNRFVDRRTAALVRGLRARDTTLASVGSDGTVCIEGEPVGRLTGLSFSPDNRTSWQADRTLQAAVRRVLIPAVEGRAARLIASRDDTFAVGQDGTLLWRQAPVGRIVPGPSWQDPAVRMAGNDYLDGARRELVRGRLQAWLRRYIDQAFATLRRAQQSDTSAAVRGLMFQLAEAGGSMRRADVDAQIKLLDRADRRQLARLGIRLGRDSVYALDMIKPHAIAARRLLWQAQHGEAPDLPPAGATSVPDDGSVTPDFYEAIGYRVVGPRAIRIDIFERLTAALRQRARTGPFPADAALLAQAGCRRDEFDSLLKALGYTAVARDGADGPQLYAFKRRQTRKRRARSKADGAQRRGSPFAVLAQLRGATQRST